MAGTANNRIFYACQAVGFAKLGHSGSDYKVAHGVQSVGITTNFNLEQAFELGQIQIYGNIEGTPDVEVTMEKVLDGRPLLYHLASQGATSAGLVGRSKERANVALGIWSDGFDYVGQEAGGHNDQPVVQVNMSGMYLSSLSYNMPIDGMATESVTLVGNYKTWLTGDSDTDLNPANEGFGSDKPASSGLGGVQRRENFMRAKSILPTDIDGVTSNGAGGIQDSCHLQSFSVSTDFSREDIFELGKKAPYYRSTNFPIEVTCDIEMVSISGDFIGAYEFGDPALYNTGPLNTTASGDNTAEQRIVFVLENATAFDLGEKNRLSSVSYGGGDATGGNVSVSYSYTNFNDLEVISSGDPALSEHGGSLKYSPAQSGYSGNWGKVINA